MKNSDREGLNEGASKGNWWMRWGPALLMMMLIFLASSTPGNDLPELGGWDTIVLKGGHMLGYALLAVSYLRALTWDRRVPRYAWLLAVILAILYALSDEYHQSFTPGRSPRMSDVGIDAVGAALGVGLWPKLRSCLKSWYPTSS
jgi:hypothetical protein